MDVLETDGVTLSYGTKTVISGGYMKLKGGHIHLKDKVVYNNVTYLCNGAVSGAWWNGNNRETAPGMD